MSGLKREISWRISIQVDDALNAVIAGPADKELSFVIEIGVRAASGERRSPLAIRTDRSVVRAKAPRRPSLIWHVSSPPADTHYKSLRMCRYVGASVWAHQFGRISLDVSVLGRRLEDGIDHCPRLRDNFLSPVFVGALRDFGLREGCSRHTNQHLEAISVRNNVKFVASIFDDLSRHRSSID